MPLAVSCATCGTNAVFFESAGLSALGFARFEGWWPEEPGIRGAKAGAPLATNPTPDPASSRWCCPQCAARLQETP